MNKQPSPAPWHRSNQDFGSIVDDNGWPVCQNMKYNDNAEGNMALIEAAPDLLQWLESAESILTALNGRNCDLDTDLYSIRAIIAKATGKEQPMNPHNTNRHNYHDPEDESCQTPDRAERMMEIADRIHDERRDRLAEQRDQDSDTSGTVKL